MTACVWAGFSGKGLLRVRTLDLNSGVQHCVYTGDSLEMARADSLSQLNIGYACEIEVTGFLLSSWWRFIPPWIGLWQWLLALAVGGWGYCYGISLSSRSVIGLKR